MSVSAAVAVAESRVEHAGLTDRPSPVGKEWLVDVPRHWAVRPLGKAVQVLVSNVDKHAEEGQIPVRLCNYTDVYKHETISADMSFMPATATTEQISRFRLRPGDVLITKDSEDWRDIGVPALVKETAPDLVCGYHLAVLRPDGLTTDGAFLSWALRGKPAATQFSVAANGITRFGLTYQSIKAVVLPFPGIEEQRAIARFLDRETDRIDALIVGKIQLIALLEEQRRSIIGQAVTRGLDPSVSVKSSGVGWLGDVPAHWRVKRVKHVARLESGHTPSRAHPEYWVGCDIPWFTLSDVWQIRDERRIYVQETAECVSLLGIANSAARLLPAETVIVSRTASVGFSGILARPMATTQDFVNWICTSEILPEYLLFVFRSMKSEFRRLTMGSTHQTIYMPDVGRFTTPVPPLNEQRAIVEHVQQSTERIDRSIAANAQQITKLREYRAALITAAVTGKVDVREAA